MSTFRQLPSTGPLETLRFDGFELIVAPACGARIAAFRFRGRDVLRPASPAAIDTAFPYGFSSFPLLPYSGPIFGGGYTFEGARYSMSRNVPAEPFATHGEGWIRPWSIVQRSENAVSLALDYAPQPGLTPFRWNGRIDYRLDAGGFATTLTLINADVRRMPAGMGFHPYFPKAPGDMLTFRHGHVWPPDDPDAVRLTPIPTPPGLDFNKGLDVSQIVLDRCYEGWNGRAELRHADGNLTYVEADPVFSKLQIYDAWDYPYVCIEPVANANDAFNRAALGVPGHGVTILEPGESLSGSIRIGIGRLDRDQAGPLPAQQG